MYVYKIVDCDSFTMAYVFRDARARVLTAVTDLRAGTWWDDDTLRIHDERGFLLGGNE